MSSDVAPVQNTTTSDNEEGVGASGGETQTRSTGSGEPAGGGVLEASGDSGDDLSAACKRQCLAILRDVVHGDIDVTTGHVKLRETGIWASEADQLMGLICLELEHRKNTADGDSTPGENDFDGTREGEVGRLAPAEEEPHEGGPVVAPNQGDIRAIFDKADWAKMGGKLDYALGKTDRGRRMDDGGRGAHDDDLATGTPDKGIPTAVLLAAPHLTGLLLATNESDPIVSTTWKIRNALTSEKCVDNIVAILQQQNLRDPLPLSIWRDIVNDKYVNFEKLFASTVPGFDHNDEPKILSGEYAVIKKNDVSRKKPVLTESDWTRVYDAWSDGVLLLYKHRMDELSSYQGFVIELFRALPNEPSRAIRIDVDVRDHYGKSPFRLDDRNIFNSFSFTRLLSKDPPGHPFDRSSSKRQASQALLRPWPLTN